MSEDLRVPSQDELDRLESAVRQNPAHFVALGEAYLALGRPRDAVELCARGLQGDPHNLAGRLMVGRALVALHQWKQAQAELLKVVKADKQNGDGFRLLGEVLMRRSDYDRALPVLQHAQNLDPANPAVLALLKRARAGKALDPPAPIPSPVAPRAARRPALPRPGGSMSPSLGLDDDEPTRVADDPGALDVDDADTGLMDMGGRLGDSTRPDVPLEQPAQIRDRLPLQGAGTQPSPTVPAPPKRAKKPSAAPPVRPPGAPKIQPRIMPAERRADAAKEGLKQSAAMGEEYLNNLLAGGLLDVPNVTVPAEELEFEPVKAWNPSAKRAFVFLFTLLFLGTAGGVSWYVYSEKQKTADVARHIDAALAGSQSGTHADLLLAVEQATQAMERDDKSAEATATFAMVAALDALLYKTDPTPAEFATTGARRYVDPGDPGHRQLVVAEAAVKLARLVDMEAPRKELADLHTSLETYLAANDDGYVRWLFGRAKLAAGDRSGAAAEFRKAETSPNPPLIATIERADLMLDDGNFDQARELYDKAMAQAANHPLAMIGLSLLRAETSTDLAQAVDDLNVHVDRVESPRVDAYKNLAFAFARYALQNYGDFEKHLDQALGLSEPRFWARVGLARLLAGKIPEAAQARQRVVWFNEEGTEREEDPLVRILDAELQLALGRPRAALDRVGKAEGLRGHSVRARALFDSGDFEEAIKELELARKIAEDDRELKAFHFAALALSSKGKERSQALADLDSLRLDSKSKVPAYLQGLVLLRQGKLDDARYQLKKSLEGISADEPNPLAYRAHTAIAEVAFRQGKLDDALGEANASLEDVAVYLPTLVLLGRIEQKRENWGAAADAFGEVVAAPTEAAATWDIELGFAEATARESETIDPEARKLAEAAIKRAKDKGATAEELARVAALYGPALLEELGLEAPEEEGSSSRRKKRRR